MATSRVGLTLQEIGRIEKMFSAVTQAYHQERELVEEIIARLHAAGVDPVDPPAIETVTDALALTFVRNYIMGATTTLPIILEQIRRAKLEVPAAMDEAYIKRSVQEIFREIKQDLSDE